MPRLTITITDDQSDLLDDLAGDGGEYESKSAAVREFIQAGEQLEECQAEIEQLRDRLDSREQRIEQLEEQLAKRSNIEQKIEDLPAKLTGRLSYQDRRQRALDAASPIERLKWRVTGVPTARIEAVDDDGGDQAAGDSR